MADCVIAELLSSGCESGFVPMRGMRLRSSSPNPSSKREKHHRGLMSERQLIILDQIDFKPSANMEQSFAGYPWSYEPLSES